MRKILDLLSFPNLDDEESEPLTVTVCGPSDRGTGTFPDQNVVQFDWRSTIGDDLKVIVPLQPFLNRLLKSDDALTTPKGN